MLCPHCQAETPSIADVCQHCRADLREHSRAQAVQLKAAARRENRGFSGWLRNLVWRVGLPGGLFLMVGSLVWIFLGLSLQVLFVQPLVLFPFGLVASIGGLAENIGRRRRAKAADAAAGSGDVEQIKARCPRCDRVFYARFGGVEQTRRARCPGCRRQFGRSEIVAAD
jgi:hypothetical protein